MFNSNKTVVLYFCNYFETVASQILINFNRCRDNNVNLITVQKIFYILIGHTYICCMYVKKIGKGYPFVIMIKKK